MILQTKDVAYFGHFNLKFILSMDSLKELEIWGDGANITSWYDNDRYIAYMKTDFEDARNADPGVSIRELMSMITCSC